MSQEFENKEIKKNIVVNYIAATTGGAYTILVKFLDSVFHDTKAKEFKWIVFVSLQELSKYNCEHINVINIKSNNWITRIHWDLFGLPRWLKRNNINVYSICSLQNTGIPFVKAPQYVYIHQPLILARHLKLKWFEYKIKIYRFIYFYSVKLSIRKHDKIIVQTKWMKDGLIKQFKFAEENIIILKPELNIEVNNKKIPDQYSYRLFYPAIPHASYKNHELIIRSINKLKEINPHLFNKIEILFTSDSDYNKVSRYYDSLIKKLNLDDKISWCGYLNSNEMDINYLDSDIILFPSKLESLGLPLVEAAYRNKNIFTLNNSFSHELLDGYKGVNFLENDPVEWANIINEFYKKDFSQNIIQDNFNLNKEENINIVKLLVN